MKAIVVDVDGTIEAKELENHWPMLKEEIGGWIEQVRIRNVGLLSREDVVMLIDEDGHLKNLDYNETASKYYAGPTGIVGKAIFVGVCRDVFNDVEWTDLPEDFVLQ